MMRVHVLLVLVLMLWLMNGGCGRVVQLGLMIVIVPQDVRKAGPAAKVLAIVQRVVLPLEHLGDRVLGLVVMRDMSVRDQTHLHRGEWPYEACVIVEELHV
jgi:hypothetical protein